ncbi:TPA: N-acetyltransferase, partial [Clostridioides difficile]|nr:N-acetyltransferase [Clostridioides difficile]HBF3466546.1 N-acetyltransferase [Clostridioides difficile]
QLDMGGKIVYLECEDKPKLIEFYKDNGFVDFGKRSLDKDETDSLDGDYLVQMLKYLKK